MQSVPITTNIMSSKLAHDVVYSIQEYVIQFISELRQVDGFLWVSSTNKTNIHDIAEILFKVVLKIISLSLARIQHKQRYITVILLCQKRHYNKNCAKRANRKSVIIRQIRTTIYCLLIQACLFITI